MKVKTEVRTYGKNRAVRFRAKIIKSPKHGIPKTVQKTWRVFCDDPESEMKEIRRMCMIQARRWQHKQMLKWFGSPEKFPTQTEIDESESNEEGKQEQSVPSVQEAGLVSSGQVTGAVHESAVKPPEANG